jgi:hypothetical protein
MKLLMVIGGLIGFSISLGFSWAQESPWPSVLWRAALAALMAGILLRWWGRLWIQGLQQSHQERRIALTKRDTPPKPVVAHK